MLRTLTCPQGHEWQTDLPDSAAAPACPECGSLAPTVTHPGAPAAQVSTIAHEGRKDAIAPGGLPSVPGYEVLAVLGRGGMGVVYKARQAALKRLVALKMIRGQGTAGPEELARFRAEAESVARLQHANIVQVYEVGEHGGQPYFSLELVESGSLDRRLAGTPQPPEEAARLVEIIARAVHAAHEKGVVHRDLKPANVLLAADGSPKITDFGLAKRLEDEGQTQTGAVMGTPSYMAPEQASGRRGIGPPVDVWALGAILYECLTGRPPFRGATLLDTLDQVRSQEPVPPSRLLPKVPRDLETITLQCLQKDLARRYGSALEVARELARFRAGEPIRARPVGAWERTVKWARRRPAPAALVASLVVGFILVTWQWLRAEQNAEGQRKANEQAQRDRDLAKRDAARLALGRGLGQCEGGDVARGLLWMVRALEKLPSEDDPLAPVIRCNLSSWSGQLSSLCSVLPHPGDTVWRIVFSADGKRVMTLAGRPPGGPGSVRLWDVASGQPLGPSVHVPSERLEVIALRPDGNVALISDNKQARQWDLLTGAPLGTPLASGPVKEAVYRRDGKSLLTSSNAGAVQLWGADTGQPLGPPVTVNHGATPSLGPAGQWALVPVFVPQKGYELRVVDPLTGKAQEEPLEGLRGINKLLVSPDGSAFAAIGGFNSLGRGKGGTGTLGVRAWDAATLKPLTPAMPLAENVFHAALAPGGRALVLTGGLGIVKLLDLSTGQVIGKPLEHQANVEVVAFSPDGRFLTGTTSRFAQLWEMPGERVGSAMLHLQEVTAAAFSPDGRFFITGSADGTARVWEAPARPGRALVSASEGTRNLWLSPGAQALVTSGWDHSVRLREAATGRTIGAPLVMGGGGANAAAFSQAAGQLVAVDQDPEVRGHKALWFWDLTTARSVRGPIRQAEAIIVVALRPDGKVVAVAGDRSAWLSEADTGKRIGEPWPHPHGVSLVAFSPDGTRAATADRDGVCTLVDGASGKVIARLDHAAAIFSIDFSPDGRLVLTAGKDRVARFWDAATGAAVGKPLTHQDSVLRAIFSPAGDRVVTTSSDRSARVWQVEDGSPVGQAMEHGGSVATAAFSPDGRILVTGARDRTARLWDAATGQPQSPPLRHSGSIELVGFLPDGQGIITSCYAVNPGVREVSMGWQAGGPTKITGNWQVIAQRWSVPTPLPGSLEQVRRWARLTTGLDMDDNEHIGPLDAERWQRLHDATDVNR